MAVSIGGIKVDLLKEFATESVLEVTSHPVEEGADVSDHARLKSSMVSMTVLVVGDKADYKLSQLEKKQRNKEQVEVIGPKRYKNMQITHIRPNYAYDVANGYVIDLTFQEVRVVKAKTYVVKMKKKNSGRKQTKKKKASTPKKTRDQMAREVIQGKWGNQPHRSRRLKAAGYNYSEIQARVNAILR